MSDDSSDTLHGGSIANSDSDDENAREDQSDRANEGNGVLCSSQEPPGANVSPRERDWATIPRNLLECKDERIHLKVFGEDMMKAQPASIGTMNAVSKCWRTIDPGSESLLTDETEGGSWMFCEKCVAQIPKNIQDFLYFFHRLKCHLTSLKGYVVPGPSITLGRSKVNKNEINQIIWHKQLEHREEVAGAVMDDEVDFNRIMKDRTKDERNEIKVQVEPIKIRLGKTGAIYTHNDKECIMTFSVLVITWARHFDMLAYIKEVFLHAPKAPNMFTDYQHLNMIWKKMQWFVAFENLGLDETQFGSPDTYAHQPGGELGVHSLFNQFGLVFQILGIVKRETLEAERSKDAGLKLRDVRISKLQIVGLPELVFQNSNMVLRQYIEYMHHHVDSLVDEGDALAQNLRKYNAPKKKEDCEDASEAELVPMGNPGAWPLAKGGARYVRFGLPRLPVWLCFTPEHDVLPSTTQSLWFASIGGAEGLPELTKMVLRFFLVQNTDPTSGDRFLQDKRPANRMRVLQQYYSEEADPLAGLVVSGSLRPWWTSMCDDLASFRGAGGSVRDAMTRFDRFVSCAVVQHESSINSGVHRSARLKQALQILDRLDFQQMTATKESSIGAFSALLCADMPADSSFVSYSRANWAFYHAFDRLNKAFMMNSSNLEFAIETMVSQIMWNLGEYNSTVPAFFQGIHVMSGNGHFKITTKESGTYTLCDKFNSSGMDWSLARVSQLSQWLLDMAGIVDPRNNLQSPTNVMNWTPVSMQLHTCASLRGHHLESLPDQSLGERSLSMSELRNADLTSLILYVLPRHSGGQQQVSMNTCDKDRNNVREAQNRQRLNYLHMCAMSSNERKPNEEQLKTLGVVMARMVGGSGPYIKKRKTGGFNNCTSDAYGGRQNKSEHQEALTGILGYTHIFSVVMPALMNKTSVMPFEISKTSQGFLDWLSSWVKVHAGGVFETTVHESYKRIKEGYEARQVTKALWTTSIMLLPGADSKEEAAARIIGTMHCNSLPIAEVVPAVHNMMTRGVHMGCLLMATVMAKHLEVPVIEFSLLKRFFNGSQWKFRPAFDGSKADRPARASASIDDDLRSIESRLAELECQLRRHNDAVRAFVSIAHGGSTSAGYTRPPRQFGGNYRGGRGRGSERYRN